MINIFVSTIYRIDGFVVCYIIAHVLLRTFVYCECSTWHMDMEEARLTR